MDSRATAAWSSPSPTEEILLADPARAAERFSAYPDSVRTVDQIVEQIRSFAGADFAFVLTRKGRLVTHRAPRDMPEEGRSRLVRAARTILGTDRIIEITLPRQELVPYGGAAPVDVYLGVAAEQAIVCAVMATWADKIRVSSAMAAGLKAIEPLLKRGGPVMRRHGETGPVKGSPFLGERRSSHPPSPGAVGGYDSPEPGPDPWARQASSPPPRGRVPSLPRGPSTPSIHVGEAELGRLSQAAVRHEVTGGGSSPDITYGDAELGHPSMVAIRRELSVSASAPEILVTGEAALGRETLAAIDREGQPRPTSSPDALRVELVSLPESELGLADDGARPPASSRITVPWVEQPADGKRAADAATVGRNLAPPKVTLKLEEADQAMADATRAELGAPPESTQRSTGNTTSRSTEGKRCS